MNTARQPVMMHCRARRCLSFAAICESMGSPEMAAHWRSNAAYWFRREAETRAVERVAA